MSLFRRKKPTQLQRVLAEHDLTEAMIRAEQPERRRIYTPHGNVAHYEGIHGALCPNMQGPGWTWLGYGDAEREYAAVLPLCRDCKREAGRLDGGEARAS